MDIKNLLVRTNAEYPQIVDVKPSPKIVAILKNLMSSSHSELSAVLQYFYQSSIAKNIEKDISNLLEEISIVEMQHLQLLSHAIVDFGGEPKYESGKGQPFDARYVNYSTKLGVMLDANILSEEIAIKEYREAITKVENKSLKKLFERIIMDEELHIKAFRYLRDNVRFLCY